MIYYDMQGLTALDLKLQAQPKLWKNIFSRAAPLPPHSAHVADETRRLAAVW
jgi:hypothetical protein